MPIALLLAVSLCAGGTEVVVDRAAPKTVRFAADELTNVLSRVLSSPVPVVSAPSAGKSSLILGTNRWSAAEGISLAGLGRDGFRLRVAGNRVFIAGRDDPAADLRAIIASKNHFVLQMSEHGTLYGVYEFLKRFAGVRFYFPGEAGTVVPRQPVLSVPDGEYGREPVFAVRDFYPGEADRSFPMCEEWLRLRLQSARIPCSHGSRDFKYIERFAKTHPEYLALKKDGSRWDNPKVFAAYQLCWSDPGLREMLYGDVKAYLTGQPSTSRGLERWGGNCVRGQWVDIMPEDSFEGCHCPRCQAAYDRSAPNGNYATKLMWGLTAEIGNRLIAEGVPGNITMMAYPPYRAWPDFALPTNVHVMVAETGPWSVRRPDKMAAEEAEIAGWAKKVGHRIWLWTYPHKFGKTAIPDIPSYAPKAWGAYFKRMSPYIFGAFCESETENIFFNYLNYYVYSELAWDPALDVDALLDEHHAKMFGSAAPEMKRFLEGLEDAWLAVAGNVVDTTLGPVAKAPSEYELATRIYSRDVLKAWYGLFKEAARKTADEPEAAMRVRYFRDRLFEPLARHMFRYLDGASVEKELARRKAHPAAANLVRHEKWSTGGQPRTETYDATTFVTGPDALHVNNRVSGREKRLYLIQMLDRGEQALKPNTRYRVSLFVKLKDVEPCNRAGGVHVELYDGKRGFRCPKSELSGTMDWTHLSFEWTTGPDTGKGALICLRLIDAFGEVWYDDVIVEEIDEKGN